MSNTRSVHDLSVRIGGNADEGKRVLEDMGGAAEKSGGRMSSAFGLAGKAALGLGAAVAGAGAAAFKLASDAAEAGDNYQKMSLRIGVSTEALSELEFAAERSGTSLETIEKGLLRLGRSADEAATGNEMYQETWDRLGISVTDANGELKSSDELMLEVADSLDSLSNDTERAAVAQELFGRSGAQLLPMLKEGSSGISTLREEARALGLTWSTSAANDAAAYQDAMAQLTGAFSGATQSIGKDLLPIFTEWIDALAGGIVWVTEFGRGVLGSWDSIKGGIVDLFNSSLELAGNAVTSIGRILALSAETLFEPYKQAAKFAFEHIRFFVVRPVWNRIGEDVVGVLNSLIDEFNSFGEHVGITIDRIDFTPITEDAPKTASERFGEMQENMTANINAIVDEGRRMADNLSTDSASVGEAWTRSTKEIAEVAAAAGEKATARAEAATREAAKSMGSPAVVAEAGMSGESVGRRWANSVGKELDGKKFQSMFASALSSDGLDVQRLGSDIGTALGTAMGGPIGGAVGAILAQKASKVIAEALGESKREKGLAVAAEELAGKEAAITGEDVRAAFAAQNLDIGKLRRQSIQKGVGFREGVIDDLADALASAIPGLGRTEAGKVARNLLKDQNFDKAASRINEERTVGAAGGFDGIVTGPTTMRLGEGGMSERVQVTPMSGAMAAGMDSAGFQGGGGGRFNFEIHIHALDPVTGAQAAEERIKGIVRNIMRTQSRLGVEMVETGGFVAETEV